MAEPLGTQTVSELDVAFDVRTGAKALVTTGSKVLLVRERHDDGTSFWTLPGGGVHSTECPSDGLERELREELHCRAVVDTPITEFWYAHDSHAARVSRYTVFDCSLLSTPVPNDDEGIFESRWVGPASLPPATLPQVRYLCHALLGPGERDD